MKVVSVNEAQARLSEIIYQVSQGECIVLKDGDREVTLTARRSPEFDLNEDSPELEAELLKLADQTPEPFSMDEFRAIGQRVLREHRE